MGVHGLTSYVSQKADLYLEDFQLNNCFLIIDGYSLASNLYNSSTKINSVFGGDYDKYAKVVTKFFDILKKCNVTPIVICDGGYEKKKVSTVKKRNLQRVYTFEKITPSCPNQQCFPLMMRHVFREKLIHLNVILFQSDFEADNEIAALAKKLDSPVLSNDSDFFIFDVQYIPLSSISFDSCEKTERGQFYIPCHIYLVDNLLRGLGGLPKTMLPLLATILGNDYIKSSQFKNFYSQLKMDKSKKTKPGQKRVKGVVNWLKNEDFDSALYKILKCLKKNVRRHVRRNISYVIKGYTNLNTPLDAYLPDEVTRQFRSENVSEMIEEFKMLSVWNGLTDSDGEESDYEPNIDETHNIQDDKLNESCSSFSEDSDSDSESGLIPEDECNAYLTTEQNKKTALFPSWLLEESRKGNVCPSINTLLLLKIYFYVPQVEDYELPHAGIITLPILQVIIGLLELEQISYWARFKGRYIGTRLEPIKFNAEITFPKLSELNKLSHFERRNVILKTLLVEGDELIESFLPDWQLYIASIVYWMKRNDNPNIRPWHVHALLMTLLVVNVICSKIGTFWQKKTFMNRYGSKLKVLAKRTLSKQEHSDGTIIGAINAVSEDDCIIAMEYLIPYFHIDDNLNRRSRNFSRNTIHLYAQLQSCFDLANTLNSLLLMPLRRSNLSMFYNGTFLYNFTANFKSRSNILSYVENLFSKAPSIAIVYKIVYDKLNSLIPSAPKQKVKVKRNKRKVERVQEVEKDIPDASDNEEFLDNNNKYSVLLQKN